LQKKQSISARAREEISTPLLYTFSLSLTLNHNNLRLTWHDMIWYDITTWKVEMEISYILSFLLFSFPIYSCLSLYIYIFVRICTSRFHQRFSYHMKTLRQLWSICMLHRIGLDAEPKRPSNWYVIDYRKNNEG